MTSPREHFEAGCRARELRYTVGADGTPVWPPQVGLEWRVSAGAGTVYATTVVRPRDGEPYDVSLVDLNEGFRMLSRVTGIPPEAVRIGQRVRLAWEDDLPVFAPA